MKQKYKSQIMEAIHEEAQALFEVGAIDEERMTEYDNACFVSKPNTPQTTVSPNSPKEKTKPAISAYPHPR